MGLACSVLLPFNIEEDDNDNLPLDLSEPTLEDDNNGNVPFMINTATGCKVFFFLSSFFPL